jgi:hypothetical protein
MRRTVAHNVYSADVILNILTRRLDPYPVAAIHPPEALRIIHRAGRVFDAGGMTQGSDPGARFELFQPGPPSDWVCHYRKTKAAAAPGIARAAKPLTPPPTFKPAVLAA